MIFFSVTVSDDIGGKNRYDRPPIHFLKCCNRVHEKFDITVILISILAIFLNISLSKISNILRTIQKFNKRSNENKKKEYEISQEDTLKNRALDFLILNSENLKN